MHPPRAISTPLSGLVSEMIVWGGYGAGGTYFDTGERYDPSTDTWMIMSAVNAPTARAFHTAVWTGSKMIVWGGLEIHVFEFGRGI